MQKVNPIGLFCMLSFMTVFSQYSFAAEGSSPIASENVTIGQLEAIQSRNFLLEQQVQTARLTRQLRESETQNSVNQITALRRFPLFLHLQYQALGCKRVSRQKLFKLRRSSQAMSAFRKFMAKAPNYERVSFSRKVV